MNSNVLGIIAAVLNLSVLVAVGAMIRGLSNSPDKPAIFENEKTRSTFNEILERLKDLESKNGINLGASLKTRERVPAGEKPKDRKDLALEKINRGIPLDRIGRELGYSRSEMGILLATARHGSTLGLMENASLQ